MAQSEFEWPALGSIRDGLDWPWLVGQALLRRARCSISDTFSWIDSAFFVHSELSVRDFSWELDHLESYLTRIRRLVTAINVSRINNLIKRGQWLKYADIELCQVISGIRFSITKHIQKPTQCLKIDRKVSFLESKRAILTIVSSKKSEVFLLPP